MQYDDNYAIFNVKELFEFDLPWCYQNFQLIFFAKKSSLHKLLSKTLL